MVFQRYLIGDYRQRDQGLKRLHPFILDLKELYEGSGIFTSVLCGPHGIGTFGKEPMISSILEKAKQKYCESYPWLPLPTGSPYQTLPLRRQSLFIDFETLKPKATRGRELGTSPPQHGESRLRSAVPLPFWGPEKAYLRFREDGPFRKFSEAHSWWLDDYALFMA